jgi:hypothetical protein
VTDNNSDLMGDSGVSGPHPPPPLVDLSLASSLSVELHEQGSEAALDPLAAPTDDDDIQQCTLDSLSGHAVDNQLSDDLSEAPNGRDSLDSGFGSADDMKFINSKSDLPLDNIEEYEEDDSDEHERTKGSDSNEEGEEPDRAYDRLSLVLPFRNLLGKNRKSSVKDEPIIVTEETDLTTSALSNSPRTNGLQFHWRRLSRSHVDLEECAPGAPGTPVEASNGSGKSVFARTRGLSLDISLLTGKEKKTKSVEGGGDVDPLSDSLTPITPLEKRKRGIRSIGDSLKKLTKGISRPSSTLSSAQQPTETTMNSFANDEPVAKFTADGIPLYWVGYQDAQFIALQPWQILLLPIVYQTERFYDKVLVDPSPSADQIVNTNEPLLSPSSVFSGSPLPPSPTTSLSLSLFIDPLSLSLRSK